METQKIRPFLSLDCLGDPVEYLLKLFNAAGLMISHEGPESVFLSWAKGCDFMHVLECFISVHLSGALTESNSCYH